MQISLAAAIDAIAADSRSSAATIAGRTAEVLLRRVQSSEVTDAETFRHEVLRAGWTLIRAHPATAPLINLVNLVFWKMEQADTGQGLRQAVATAASEFQRRLRYHEGRIAEAALPLIGDGCVVLTYSHSSTVRAALLHAHRAGRRFTVICAETRPLYEGRELAVELAEAGITAVLRDDPTAQALVPTTGLVLVGAEHLTGDGLVNRVGTSRLALVAKTANIPIYGLCGSEKFLPPDYAPPPIIYTSDEIWAEAPSGVNVRATYFDRTPLSDLSGIVTEQGVLVMPAIEAWLAAIKLHRALRDAHSER